MASSSLRNAQPAAHAQFAAACREDEFHRVRDAGAMVFTRSQLDSLLRTGALPPTARPTKADPPRLYSRSGMSAGCVFTRSLGDRGARSCPVATVPTGSPAVGIAPTNSQCYTGQGCLSRITAYAMPAPVACIVLSSRTFARQDVLIPQQPIADSVNCKHPGIPAALLRSFVLLQWRSPSV